MLRFVIFIVLNPIDILL